MGGRLWNTFSLRNGRHVLELRAYGRKGTWTRHRFTVRVKNELSIDFALIGRATKASP